VEFVSLAVLLDAFARRCLGWALRRSLEAVLVLEALRMALMRRQSRDLEEAKPLIGKFLEKI
jgi:transposase InsO family protein